MNKLIWYLSHPVCLYHRLCFKALLFRAKHCASNEKYLKLIEQSNKEIAWFENHKQLLSK